MKKLITLTLCTVMALSFVACSNDKQETKDNPPKQTSNMEIPSPWIALETIADAEKLAGFTITLPSDMPDGYVQKTIEAVENDSVQIIYENGDNTIMIRKAKGSEDISGDYNEYSDNKTLTVGSLQVSTKGNNGKVNVATWVDGLYTYAVSINADQVGLDASVISDMISGIR